MDRQDFEQYARQKTFNESVAETWRQAFDDVLERTGRPAGEIRFLDYGCGDGKYFRYLLAHGLSPEHVHGIEISRLRVERCHALGWTLACYVEKGARLPYADESFDVVNMMEVIEHVPGHEIDRVLAEIRRVLRPEGVLIGSTPNYPVKRFYDFYDALAFRKWQRLRDDPTHVSLYNHARLRRVLERSFSRIELRCFKTGFLYRRVMRSPWLMHKMLFICSGMVSIVPADNATA